MYENKNFHKKEQQNTWLRSTAEFIGLLILVFIIRTIGFGLYQVPTGSMETTMLVGERFFADKFTILFSPIKRGEVIAFNDPTYPYSSNTWKKLFEEYIWGPTNWTKRVIGIPGDTIKGAIENGVPIIYVNDVKLDEPYLNKYPLIHVWKSDISSLMRMTERQLLEQWGIKSYDPSKPYLEQEFYRIHPERIIKDPATRQMLPLLYPQVPVSRQERLHEQAYAGQGLQSSGAQRWDGSDEFYVELKENQYWLMGDNRRGSKDCRYIGPVDGRLIHGRIKLRLWSIDSDEAWWILDLLKHPIDFWKRIRWGRFFQWIS